MRTPSEPAGSALARSYREHAEKLKSGQRAWTRTFFGYSHMSGKASLDVAKGMDNVASSLENDYVV